MLKRILRFVLFSFPPSVRPILTRSYYVTIMLSYAFYFRIACRRISNKNVRDLDSIMRSLDHWAIVHSGIFKNSWKGYLPADVDLTFDVTSISSPNFGIMQVREEISEFLRILLLKNIRNNILEIGIGNNGGTHILWRHIFNTVITIDMNPASIRRVKLSEWLDGRSKFIEGRSEDPATLERVKAIVDDVDVLFIDGNHAYEYVRSDWEMYHNLVRVGGLVAFHDSLGKTNNYGVAKFLEQLSTGLIDGKHYTMKNIFLSSNIGISYYEQTE